MFMFSAAVLVINHPQVPVLFPSLKHQNGSLTPLCLHPESWLWTSPLRPVGRGCVVTPSWSLRSTCWTPRVCRDRSPTEVRSALVPPPPPKPNCRSTGRHHICMSMVLVVLWCAEGLLELHCLITSRDSPVSKALGDHSATCCYGGYSFNSGYSPHLISKWDQQHTVDF